MCKHVCNFAKTRAVIEDGVVKSMVAEIKLPVNAGGDACARVAGGELQAAAKTVAVPTSPTEVQATFVGLRQSKQTNERGEGEGSLPRAEGAFACHWAGPVVVVVVSVSLISGPAMAQAAPHSRGRPRPATSRMVPMKGERGGARLSWQPSGHAAKIARAESPWSDEEMR